MVSPGQVLAYVNPEEPEAVDVEMEVVVLASRCQSSDLSVGCLIVAGNHAENTIQIQIATQ